MQKFSPVKRRAPSPRRARRRAVAVGYAAITVVVFAAGCGAVQSAASASEPTGTDAVATVDEHDETTHGDNTECFEAVDHATSFCTDELLVIESDGLPYHLVMVGVDEGGWNGQWPEAQDYTGDNAFELPLWPSLLENPVIIVRNAAGVAANGVPIFLPQSPGKLGSAECLDIELLGEYEAQGECVRDPVVAGEMDDCGGHTGRGNDYHYHSAPTCLLETLSADAIAGFMMDGVAIYAEPIEGSTAYNSCGGYVSPDGEVHYAFTAAYPYVTNCLIGGFDEGPRTSGSDVYTGGFSHTELGGIIGYSTDGDCHVMEFASGRVLEYCHS